ncbi:hypothetical protein VNO78_18461 [Psophocarpus tetragonolobus]|uniref:Uncharacterized protein n=1 Tax=Psophocarpus tetragonolobus TaxID=3891 RepID=A0AAN9SIF9_PSOTE
MLLMLLSKSTPYTFSLAHHPYDDAFQHPTLLGFHQHQRKGSEKCLNAIAYVKHKGTLQGCIGPAHVEEGCMKQGVDEAEFVHATRGCAFWPITSRMELTQYETEGGLVVSKNVPEVAKEVWRVGCALGVTHESREHVVLILVAMEEREGGR